MAERVVIERLDYKFTVSLYSPRYRVFACSLSRLTAAKLLELSSAPALHSVPLESAAEPTLTATIAQHRTVEQYSPIIDETSLIHVLTCVTPSRTVHRFVLTGITEMSNLSKFVAIMGDVAHNQRSEQWLIIPEASQLQSAILHHHDLITAEHSHAHAQAKSKSSISQRDVRSTTPPHPMSRIRHSSPKKMSFTSPTCNELSSALPDSWQQAPLIRPRAIISTGIANLGNSCYMSAILQALLTLHPFVDDLCSEHLINQWTSTRPHSRRGQSLYLSLVELVVRMHRTGDEQEEDGAVDISGLKSVIGNRHARFAGSNQQDAHEFMSECMNVLHDEVTALINGKDVGTPLTPASPTSSDSPRSEVVDIATIDESDSDLSHNNEAASHSDHRPPSPSPKRPPSTPSPSPSASLSSAPQLCSPIYKNFRTEIEYTLTCTNALCGYSRKNVEHFHDLSLDIPDQIPPTNMTAPVPVTSGNVQIAAESSSPTSSPLYYSRSPSPSPLFDHSPLIGPDLLAPAPSSIAVPVLDLTRDDNPISPMSNDASPINSLAASTFSSSAEVTSSLPLPPSTVPRKRRYKAALQDMSSLTSLLRTFFQPRIIECHCSRCGHNTVRITSHIRRLPRILVLHLKRFLPNMSRRTYEKRNDRVNIDTTIDIAFACDDATIPPMTIDAQSSDEYVRRRMAEMYLADTNPTEQDAEQTPPVSSSPDLPSPFRIPSPPLPPSSAPLFTAEALTAATESTLSSAAQGYLKRVGMAIEDDNVRCAGNDRKKRLKEEDEWSEVKDRDADRDMDLDVTDRIGAALTQSQTIRQVNGDVTVQMHSAMSQEQADATPAAHYNADGVGVPLSLTPQRRSSRLVKHTLHPTAASTMRGAPIDDKGGPVLSSCGLSRSYHLQGIVQHRGAVAYSGHYVTDVRNNDEWTRYDDQYVKPITQDAALRRAQIEGYIFTFTSHDITATMTT